MNIYLASNWDSQGRIREIRDRIRAHGHDVTSSWLDEGPEFTFDTLPPLERQALSEKDRREVAGADLFILDTLDPHPTGGCEVEYGMALFCGERIWRVGPARNIFHEQADLAFMDWDAALRALSYARV